MLKLKWLKINRYKHVRPGVELHFNDGMNVLLGVNGTGKTTLLDLISALIRSDFKALGEVELDLEYRLVHGAAVFDVQLVNRREPLAGIPGVIPQSKLVLDLTVSVTPSSGATPVVLTSDKDGLHVPIKHPTEESISLPVGMVGVLAAVSNIVLKSPFPEGFLNALRFDESLGLFNWILDGEAARLKVIVSVNVQDQFQDLMSPFFTLELQRDIRDRKLQANGDPLRRDRVSEAFLAVFARATGSVTAEMSSDLLARSPWGENGSIIEYRNFRFRFDLPGGVTISEQDLSYGEKRLLSFLYYSAANSTTIIADELINGLHHKWIDLCLEQLGDRQSFLTSQNPLLFDHMALESAADAQSKFVLCHLEGAADAREMVWSQMTQEQSEQIFDAYDAGIEHVGAILRTRGVW